MIENKRIETAEQSAAEEQIQAEITFREELIEEAVRKERGVFTKTEQNNCLYAGECKETPYCRKRNS